MKRSTRVFTWLLSLFVLFQHTLAAHLKGAVSTSTAAQDDEYFHHLRQSADSVVACGDRDESECQHLLNANSESEPLARKLIQKTGLIRVLVLLIEFSDHKKQGRKLPTPETINEVLNGNGVSDIIPTGSAKKWFEVNSYGRLKFEAEVIPWKVANNTEEFYSFGRSGITQQLAGSFTPTLEELDSQGFDFSRFDQDGDGVIDLTLVMHSSYSAELGGWDCINSQPVFNRIWMHTVPKTVVRDGWTGSSSGIKLGGYGVSSALYDTCGNSPQRIGSVVFPVLQSIGLQTPLSDWNGGGGLGNYDVMSNPFGADRSSLYPSHLSPWSKMQLGWAEPTEIKFDGTYTMEPSAFKADVYIVKKGFPDKEYLLIENRQQELFDIKLNASGILIYHIDGTAPGQTKPGYPGQKGWPGNGEHYQVGLLQADGKYDLEKKQNMGDEGDFWTPTSSALSPGLVETEATNRGIYPNTNSYQFGEVKQIGISISDFKFIGKGKGMSFRVSGLGVAPSTEPQGETEPTDSYFLRYKALLGNTLKECKKREGVPPVLGQRCGRKTKTCLFGDQTCSNGRLEPKTRCDCKNNLWTCTDIVCAS